MEPCKYLDLRDLQEHDVHMPSVGSPCLFVVSGAPIQGHKYLPWTDPAAVFHTAAESTPQTLEVPVHRHWSLGFRGP